MAHDVLAGVAAGDIGAHSRSPALRVTAELATGAEDRIGVKIGQNAVRVLESASHPRGGEHGQRHGRKQHGARPPDCRTAPACRVPHRHL